MQSDTLDIHATILSKLDEIAATRGVRILYACESGSRAWGFPSPDSDYDVRFIYAHPLDWYLTIQEGNDTIDLPVNDVLDVSGWDIRKALRLLAKHNAILFEWMQSPVVYRAEPGFIEAFRAQAAGCFSPIAGMHHYLSMSKSTFEAVAEGDAVKLKKVLYCLRTALAAKWIAHHKSVPPMEFAHLLPVAGDEAVEDAARELVRLKATMDESYLHPRNPHLIEFLRQTLAECTQVASSLPAAKSDYTELDAFFRTLIAPAA